ncbi:MAG: COX15/CtaA family protein [Anaerolineales bacterium]|nr:COX15/CtaA family protein [Chloroflexota bacterium]MBL6981622.1 COX15/CtaA family protein [Anaerolineales bacterium]
MMPKTQNRAVMTWLFIFAFIVGFLIVFGGFVRLTRSGLSIVEWDPITGVLPPIGEQAWEEEFAKYQESPEFQLINSTMSLDGFKKIFFIEWLHRLIARLAGLAYAIPVFYFLFRGAIPRKEFGIYVLMGLLFIGQAFMGWFMVASGLVDRPSVSHIRLTAHLLLAILLLALSLWVALGHRFGFPIRGEKTKWSPLSRLAVVGIAVLLIQITYGGFTAGLKAGYLSTTWPLMFGKLLPPGLFDKAINLLVLPKTVVFVHRWFAFVALFTIGGIYLVARKRGYGRDIANGILGVLILGCVQIVFGIFVVLFQVQISLALIHQAIAVLLFSLTVYTFHRLRALDLKNLQT